MYRVNYTDVTKRRAEKTRDRKKLAWDRNISDTKREKKRIAVLKQKGNTFLRLFKTLECGESCCWATFFLRGVWISFTLKTSGDAQEMR